MDDQQEARVLGALEEIAFEAAEKASDRMKAMELLVRFGGLFSRAEGTGEVVRILDDLPRT